MRTDAFEVDLNPLVDKAPQHRDLNVAGGPIVEENEHMETEKSISIKDFQHVETSELDKSKFRCGDFSESEVEHGLSNSTKQSGNTNEDSLKNLGQIGISSNYGMKKSIESFSTLTNLSENSPRISQVSS